MSTETETGVARRLKLKLKLAINRSKSSNGDLGVRKGRILGGGKGLGREEKVPDYESRGGRSVKGAFRSNVRDFDVKGRGEFREASNSGSVGVRRKSGFSRGRGVENEVRRGSNVEKPLRTIWVPSRNDGVGGEKKQSSWRGKGRSLDGNGSQWKVKKFEKREAAGQADFEVDSFSKDSGRCRRFKKAEGVGVAYRGNDSLNKDLGKSGRNVNVGGRIGEERRSGEVVSTDEQPRKRKRIRIHRLDVSNKRLDDAISSDG